MSTNNTLSVIVIIGYLDQPPTEESPGDEIDHCKVFLDCDRPVELTIVDRAWPARQDKVYLTFESARVRYIPPRPTEWIERGMWAVSASMNSGAICSNGDLLMMSGDYNVFTPKQLQLIYDSWFDSARLYQPVLDYKKGVKQIPTKIESIKGLNIGPRVLPRYMFGAVNGWDEWFDGTRGHEDEWFDMMLDVPCNRLLAPTRYRHPTLVVHKTLHAKGTPPQKYVPPWTKPNTPGWNRLRCNLAYGDHILKPQMHEGNFRGANSVLDKYDLQEMRKPCHKPNCFACRRPDRDQQLDSYLTHQGPPAPMFELMHRFQEHFKHTYGSFNPWQAIAPR